LLLEGRVALLKANKLGVPAGRSVNLPGLARAIKAFLSLSGVMGSFLEGWGRENSLSERREERVGHVVECNWHRWGGSHLDSLGVEEVESLGSVDRQEVGEHTADVGRSHRGTRNSVGGLVSCVPGGKDVESGCKDVDTLAVVGEVGSVVLESGCTDSYGLLGRSGRVRASVFVVTVQVETSFNSSIDGIVERLSLATAKRHVGD
jgi:hypothetical protein